MQKFFGKGKDEKKGNVAGKATDAPKVPKRPGGYPAGKATGAIVQPKAPKETVKSKNPKDNDKIVLKSAAQRTGNQAGLKSAQKQNAFVNFGPIIVEFLKSNRMANKVVRDEYTQDGDTHKIMLTFQPVLENGVSLGEVKSLSIEDYLATRNALLGKNDPSTRYIAFCGRLLDRLGLDLTNSRPQVNPEDVEKFISRHLSPIEREVVKLSKEEWDTIDSSKLDQILKPTNDFIAQYYKNARGEFLIKSINSDHPVVVEPPNWVSVGLGTISKATLLNSLRVEKQISENEKLLLDEMKAALLQSLSGEGEESKNSDSTRTDG